MTPSLGSCDWPEGASHAVSKGAFTLEAQVITLLPVIFYPTQSCKTLDGSFTSDCGIIKSIFRSNLSYNFYCVICEIFLAKDGYFRW